MPPKPAKKFAAKVDNDDDEPVVATTRKAKTIDNRVEAKKRLLARLTPMMEKLGGRAEVASEMLDLHKPRGYVSTGIYALDIILSGENMGIPQGRLVEVFGPESAGKSAVCEFVMGRFNQIQGIVHHIDAERTRNDRRLERCYGVGPDDFIDVDAPHLEAVWDYAYTTAKVLHEEENPAPNLIVLDSLAAVPAKSELEEKTHEDSHVGLQARSNSKGVRKVVRLFSETSAVFLFVNQQRDKIGAMGYGPKTDTPGGRALKYAYSIRLQVTKVQSLKKGDTVVGQLTKVTTVKNKHAPPKMDCELVLSYKTGIDADESNFLFFLKNKVLTAAGKKGYLWNKEDAITKAEWPEWHRANKKKVMAAVADIRTKILKSSSEESNADEEVDDDADE